MKKQEFLEQLKTELKNTRCADVEAVIEYYDEIIEDKIESGLKEKDIISELNIKEIIKNVKIEQKLEIATKKPTVSNGIKALLAVLSVLSLPILIPLLAVVFAIGITLLALLFSLVVVVGSILIAGIVSIVALFAGLFTGNLPFATFIFAIGVTLVIIGLFSLLMRWIINISKDFVVWSINKLKTKFSKRKEVKENE